MVYLTVTTEDILQHVGVKGMKWGVRKKREKSKNEVKAEATVEARKKALKTANLNLQKQTRNGLIPANQANLKAVSSAGLELKYAKEDLSSTRILEKLSSKPKSAMQLKAEEKYKAKGHSPDEAAVEAYKNIRVKKALTIAAGTAITVGSIYAGVKISDNYLDRVIKGGTSLQNIAADNDGVRDAFYSSKNALDKMKYKGLYGKTLMDRNGTAYAKEIKVLSDIKRVSPNNAKKALQELIDTDPEFSKGIKSVLQKDNLNLGDTYAKKAMKYGDALKAGKVNKDLYETFNASLVDHSPEMQKLTDKFYDNLSKKGYNAIKDVNDSKYSGYNALNPIIAFGTKGKVSVVDVKQLAKAEVDKNYNKSMAMLVSRGLTQVGATYVVGIGGAVTGVNAINRAAANKAADKYIKANPNTKMSRTEIRRMLERAR